MTGHAKTTIRRPFHRGVIIGAVLIVELLALVVAYQFFAQIECGQTGAFETCRFLRSLVARALVVFAAFGVLIWARPAPFAAFLTASARHSGPAWMVLHLAGVALLWLPLIIMGLEDMSAFFGPAAILWTAGSALAAVGGLFWIAAPRDWLGLLSQENYMPLLVLGGAVLVPDLADRILPIWDWQVITGITFSAVYMFLSLFSDTTYADPAAYIIGVEQFAVHIARQCSGVEGVALVTAFVALYALIFRKDIRFPHYWLVVLPLGILLSLILNVVRIGALILIGAHISPDLAVNGFHSYAGWLFFTILALGIVYGVQKIRWLHRDPEARAEADPVKSDPVAGYILPFVVFMLTSVITQALFPHPALGYPLVALALAGAVWYFRKLYLALEWRADPVALGAGAVVGIGWAALAQSGARASELDAALAGLAPALLAVWIVARLAGTVLLVPLVEELFFRGYVMARLDRGGWPMRIVAVAVSTALFAALHGRWLAAGLAGLVFALVMLRRGRVGDAVLAHLTANLIVAGWALAMNDFTLI